MKKTNILYWTFTILFSIMMLGSAIPDVLSSEVAVQGMHEGLGYPVYIIPFIGIAKVLGVITILVPGFPKLREWAYAGLFIDLAGATYSILAAGSPVSALGFMIMPIAFGVLSYYFYHRRIAASIRATHTSEFVRSAA
jgi:hypothetical protein